MDKIIRCKVCGKGIAKSANPCPHCGAKTNTSKLEFLFNGPSLGILVVVLTLLLFLSHKSRKILNTKLNKLSVTIFNVYDEFYNFFSSVKLIYFCFDRNLTKTTKQTYYLKLF